MRKNKKPIILLFITLCIFLLTGWGKKAVELLSDKKLIDLNKAIQDAPIGNQGNTTALDETEVESDGIITDNPSVKIPVQESIPSQENKKIQYIISIKDETITYDNSVCDSIDTLKNRIISNCGNGAGSVYLIDDFAEAHVYKEVLEILNQLHGTMKLEYSFE